MCIQYSWLDIAILGALTELQKANTSFVMSVRRSVHMEQQLDCHWEEFHEILYLSIRKSLRKLKFNYINIYLN